jgi:heme-degrading monooxygenase HmoA
MQMSVLMTMIVQGDPAKLEEYAEENQEKMAQIADRGRAAGAISHRFYGSEQGRILAVDEWDSPESFRSFFESDEDIPVVMQQIGVTSEPEVTFWRKLQTRDEF